MQILKQILLVNLLCLSVVSCGSKKSKDPQKINTPSQTTKEVDGLDRNNFNNYFYSVATFPEHNVSIEVIYQIDQETNEYREWVLSEFNNNIKVSHFTFKYDEDTYKSLLKDSKTYFSSFDPKPLSESQVQSLENRFSSNFTYEEFEALKTNVFSDIPKENIRKFDKKCEMNWNKIKDGLADLYAVRLQICQESKYHKFAVEDTEMFLAQNRFLTYPNMFGLSNVYPQTNTFLEFSNDGTEFLGIGTAYSSQKYFLSEQQKKSIERRECAGNFLFKNVSDFGKDKEMFLGSSKNPIFMDSLFFINECLNLYSRSSYEIEKNIEDLYPDASKLFRKNLKESVSTYFYVKPIDINISQKLDTDIEKYKFRIKSYNEANEKELYQSWKEVASDRESILFDGVFIPLNNLEKSYEILRNYVLREDVREGFFFDEPDVFYEEDKKAFDQLKIQVLNR